MQQHAAAARLIYVACIFVVSPLTGAQQPTKVTTLESGQTYGYANADYNGDGLRDHFAIGHDPDSEVIWYSQPDRTFIAGPPFRGYINADLKIDRHGCVAADFNLDQRMDFYCAVGASQGVGHGNNELWLQQPNGSFVRDVTTHGALDPYGRGRHVVAFNLNKGPSPDLYVVNKGVPRDDGEPNIKHVYKNDSTGHFTEVITIATVAMETTCQGQGDVNRDGLGDLFVCPIGEPARIYVNNGRNDFNLLALPMADKRWRTAEIRHIDQDEYVDLVVSTVGGTLEVFLNTGDPAAPFKAKPIWSAQLPNANGVSVAIGDLDGDRRPDLYVVLRQLIDLDGADCPRGHDPVDDVVFMSKGMPSNTWRMVQLVQDYWGCGYEADYLGDRRISLTQGGTGWKGPALVLDWTPEAEAAGTQSR